MPNKTPSKHYKIVFSGVPSAGKTSVVVMLKNIFGEHKTSENASVSFKYNTGRSVLKQISPSYRSTSFLTMLRSSNKSLINKFLTYISKLKENELKSSNTVFSEKTLTDYILLLSIIYPNLELPYQIVKKAQVQASIYDYIFLLDPPATKAEFIKIPGRPNMPLQNLLNLHKKLKNYLSKNSHKVINIPRYGSAEKQVQSIVKKLPKDLRRYFIG